MSLSPKYNSSHTPQKRALIIGSEQLRAYHWSRRRLSDAFSFTATPDGFEMFRDYLRHFTDAPTYILLDTAAEEFHQDTMPHAFGADRKVLLRRKMERVFPQARYCHAAVQGRENFGRRDDKIVLSAVSDAHAIQPWMELMEMNNTAVAAILSTSLLLGLAQEFTSKLSGNALLCTLQSVGGLRQSLFQERALKFSRLVKMPPYNVGDYVEIMTGELRKVTHYLERSHIIDGDKPLDIYFVGAGELLERLTAAHTDSLAWRYHTLDLRRLAAKRRFDIPPSESFCDAYLADQALRHAPRNYYASAGEMRHFYTRRLGKILQASSVLLMLTAAAWGGLNVLEGTNYRQHRALVAPQTDFYRARIEKAERDAGASPANLDDLKTIIDASELLKAHKADPLPMLRLFAEGLSHVPNIQIQALQWSASIDPNDALGAEQAGDAVEERAGHQTIASATDDPEPYLYYQIGLFEGYLEPFDGDYRNAFAIIETFAAFLREQPSVYEVRIVKLPLDVGSDQHLHGALENEAKNADFSLRVALGVKHEV